MIQEFVAFPRLTMLSHEQCEAVHRASLEILRRTGARIYHEEALELLRQTDAVITDENLVRLPPGLVEWALKQAPSRIGLCARGGDQVVVHLEGRQVNFGPGSDCIYTIDVETGERRRATAEDVRRIAHLCDGLDQIDFIMSMGNPSDAPSLDIYIQNKSPDLEKESNWLPAPAGDFRPILRFYQPRPEALDGTYELPPIRRVI